MSNTIQLSETAVNTLIGTWTGLQLERGVSSTNLASFQIVAQLPYVVDQTTYTYVDNTGAVTDWYRVVRYGPSGLGTYSPPWPVTPPITTTGDGARRSLKNCRRVLARKLGSIQVATTTDDGDAGGNTLISRGLANQIDANRYKGWWIMPTDGVSAGQIRIAAENALNPASGQLTVAPPMLSQIVKGTQLELHKLLPPDDAYGTPGPVLGLRQALNMALGECWILDRLAVATTTAATYDLSTLGDWLDPSAVTELYGPSISAIPAIPWGDFVVRGQAQAVDLDVIGMVSGMSVSVELTRPGDTYMKVGGVWLDNQQGFQNDTDECLFQPAFLTEIALAYCYDALANGTTGPAANRYLKLAEDKRRGANIAKLRLLPHPPERPHAGVSYGDSWMGWLK
jgi:hypothetical protein